jgi:hypothetical protein
MNVTQLASGATMVVSGRITPDNAFLKFDDAAVIKMVVWWCVGSVLVWRKGAS